MTGAFPTAEQIATALVAAARMSGEDPEAIVLLRQPSRARHVAFAALVATFTQARKTDLGRCCGYPKPHLARELLQQARNAKSWDEDRVDEIVGVLVAERYGEQAA